MDDDSEGQGNSASGHWQPLPRETGEPVADSTRHSDIAATADGMSSAAEDVDDENDELVDIDDGDADEAIDMVAVRFELSSRI